MDLALYPSETTPSVSKHILDEIASGEIWLRLPYNDKDSCKVQFSQASMSLYQREYFFTITLAKEVPRRMRLLMLFPESRAVLDTAKIKDMASINKFIACHIGKEPKSIQAVLCVGDSLYKVIVYSSVGCTLSLSLSASNCASAWGRSLASPIVCTCTGRRPWSTQPAATQVGGCKHLS